MCISKKTPSDLDGVPIHTVDGLSLVHSQELLISLVTLPFFSARIAQSVVCPFSFLSADNNTRITERIFIMVKRAGLC